MDEESNKRVQQYLLDNDIKEAWLGLIQSMDGVLNIFSQSVSFLYGEGNINKLTTNFVSQHFWQFNGLTYYNYNYTL